jgi:hypothetical protein
LGSGATAPGQEGRSWTSQRRWYIVLTTFNQSFEDFYSQGPNSYFGHATDNPAGTDTGSCCGGGGGGPYLAWPQEPFSTTLSGAAQDLDGDGISNLDEYTANAGNADVWVFALAAITAAASAPDQDVVEAVAGSIGGSVTLTIPNVGSATSATWTLDGDTQAGETGITLELTDLVAGDSGAYVASFNDGSAANTYTANLTVTAAPTGLPVAGLFGLVTLVVGLAAGGTAAMRRRK